MKSAKVIPLHKGGSKTDPNNYRPISLLPIFSKVLEKAVYSQLSVNCEEQVLTDNQFGFRCQSEPLHCIMNLLNNVVKNEKDKLHLILFLDVRKAFDCVDHEILCKN